MGLTHFPNGVASYGMPTMGMPADKLTLGDVYFVDASHAKAKDAVGWGKSADRPFATIDYAIGRCTAGKGDLILVAARHAESVTAITLDVADVWVCGLGHGAARPQITGTGATNIFAVSGVGCRLSNMVLILGVATIAHGVNVTGNDAIIEGIETRKHDTSQFTNLITVTDAERVIIRDCTLRALDSGAGSTSGLNIDGSDDLEISNVIVYGNFGEHALDNTTAASVDQCLRVYIHDSIFINTSTDNGDLAIDMADAATGVILRCYARGGAETLAGNVDIGNCWAFELYAFDDADETDKTGQLALPAAAAD